MKVLSAAKKSCATTIRKTTAFVDIDRINIQHLQ